MTEQSKRRSSQPAAVVAFELIRTGYVLHVIETEQEEVIVLDDACKVLVYKNGKQKILTHQWKRWADNRSRCSF